MTKLDESLMAEANTFDEVMKRWDWRPIANCPGRYRLRKNITLPQDIVGADLPVERHRVSAAPDEIWLVRFEDGGGLLSYRREDGSFVHTLNNAEGLARKLHELGIN